MNAGFILLYRQITEWEWYKNPNTFRVFLHCLLMANFTDGRFEGKPVNRGQFVTSLPSLAKQTSLSIQQVRTALDHLKSTGEITDKAYNKYRVITVVKYDDYQKDNRQNNSQSTGNQQADNRQSTGNQQQYNNNNKDIREKWNNVSFMADAEAQEIQAEQNRVLDAAEDAGFGKSNSVRAGLLKLYAYYGLEKMLAGFESCVKHGVSNIAYLEACLKGTPKKAKGAQDYEQRDYSAVQNDAMKRQAARIAARKDASNFAQRDYSDVPGQIMTGIAEELKDFQKGAG